ncbi:MAG: polysaccharide pyruvyl transferase family protein [Clostridiaceae bacterium]
MRKFLIYGNGSFDNRGCEAITRGTSNILKQSGLNEITFASFQPDIDKKTLEQLKDNIIHIKRGRESMDNILFELLNRGILTKFAYKIPCTDMIEIAKKNYDFALCSGGDNYCYPGSQGKYYRLNRSFSKSNTKLIFWGCSLEDDLIDDLMLKDLKNFHKIIARESLTYKVLERKGLNNISLHSDPAFAMESDLSFVPKYIEHDNYLGINISPLTFSYNNTPDKMKKYVFNLIKYILKNTDLDILLIPHVMGINNDQGINKEIEMHFNTKRVINIKDNLTAPQIKGIISKCKFFIGARTHATIAAYSSYVPTLTLGYSVKAKGIATDLFGTNEDNVIPVQTINNEKQLINNFLTFLEQSDYLKNKLIKTIPDYIKNAYSAYNSLVNLNRTGEI